MELDTIKNEMKKLWKETFNDSSEYINLIFDHYFDKDYIAYRICDGKLASALLSIPYNFVYKEYKLRGLYLCGLATKKSERGKGLMSELIDEINSRFADKNIAFTFLIPATVSLVNYYKNNKYYGGIYREKIGIISEDILDNLNVKVDTENEISRYFIYDNSHEIIDNKSEHKIRCFIQEIEKKSNKLIALQHSNIDIKLVLKEAIISGNKIIVTENKFGDISCVIFYTKEERERKIIVTKIYKKEEININSIINFICKIVGRDYNIDINLPIEDKEPTEKTGSERIIEMTGVEKSEEEIYGMVRIVNKNEILKFVSRSKGIQKFSNLVEWLSTVNNTGVCSQSDDLRRNDDLEEEQEEDVTIKCNKSSNKITQRLVQVNENIQYNGIFRLPFTISLLLD